MTRNQNIPFQSSGTDHQPARPQRARGKRPLTQAQWTAIALLLGVPLALVVFKSSGLVGSDWLASSLSFEHLPHDMRARTRHVLFTPMGALIVVLFRLTLGLRVLGPFRSVLLAVAFQVTGVLVGLGFFALVISVVVFLRPRFKALKMPYFGRASAMLVAVAATIVGAMLVGEWLGVPAVLHAAFFPVVVLTLAGDAFSATLRKEGARSAFWRAGATAFAAVLITLLSQIPALQRALLAYPELILCCLAGVILVGRFLAFRWLQKLNPEPVRRKARSKSASTLPAAARAASLALEASEIAPPPVAGVIEVEPIVVGAFR